MAKRKSSSKTVGWETIRELARSLPGAEESTSYGTPAFKVRKKLFARLHQDGENVVLLVDPSERDALLAEQPDAFHITDHYLNYPYVLMRLATVSQEELLQAIMDAWRLAGE